jgi:uncharacterized protein (TIGR02444 family)
MTAPAATLSGPQWRFAVTLYGRPGVAEACLALQDRWRVDVSVLIAMLYADLVAGRALDREAIAAADARIAAWRTGVVQPLRRTRQDMKDMSVHRRHAAARDLREQVKAAELKAEQIELMELAGWIAERPAGEGVGGEAVAAMVVSHFAGDDGAAADPATAADLARIAAAAAAVATEQVPA